MDDRRHMNLRLPPALMESLRARADENKRSMTREIEIAVERHLSPAPAVPQPEATR